MPRRPAGAAARNSPPASSTVLPALNSIAPPSPLVPAETSTTAPARDVALLSAHTLTVPPGERSPLPRAETLAPASSVASRPARIAMSPPRTPVPPGAATVPETATSPSATSTMRPSRTTTLVACETPFTFTTSLKSGAVPTKRAPL